MDYRLIVFDADDTLRSCTVKGQPCPNTPEEWILKPNVKDVLSKINWGSPQFGQVAFGIASNQGGISLGYIKESVARKLLHDLAFEALGIHAEPESIKLCPHHPKSGCICRKPNPEMLLQLMQMWQLSPTEVLFVGDRDTDEKCAINAGCDFMYAKDFFKIHLV